MPKRYIRQLLRWLLIGFLLVGPFLMSSCASGKKMRRNRPIPCPIKDC